MSAFFAFLLFNCAGPEPADSVDSESPPGCEPAVEVCNEVDDDCDGEVDLPLPAGAPLWYRDLDGDGHGITGEQVQACDPPEGYAPIADDCDDTRSGVYPGAPDPDPTCGDGIGDCAAAGECRYAGVFDLSSVDAVVEGDGTDVLGVSLRAIGDVDADTMPDVVTGPYLLDWVGPGVHPFTAIKARVQGANWQSGSVLVGPASDFDGDGIADLLFTTWAPNGADHSYELWLIRGPVAGEIDLAVAGVRLDTGTMDIGGSMDQHQAVAMLGDVDGDGFSDAAGQCSSGPHAGYVVCLLTGSAGGADRSHDAVLWDPDQSTYPAPRIAGLDDVDGDGQPDFGIGAPSVGLAAHGAGGVYVFMEWPSGDKALTDADALLFGQGEYEQAGTDLDGAGDVNGDGYADILVGNRTSVGTSETVEQVVAATLVLGPVPASISLADAEARFLAAEGYEGNLGMRVRGLGDLDGDTRAEVGLGSHTYGGWDWNGSVLVYAGGRSGTVPLEDADVEFRSEQDGAYVGYHFDGVGDIDGDGRDDLAFGDTNYEPAGRVLLVTGHTW